MAFGFGKLRLSPIEFWSMTLREITAASVALTGFSGAGNPPPRSSLTHMLEDYPDDDARRNS